MSDPDFNLLVALDVLLAEASVAGGARGFLGGGAAGGRGSPPGDIGGQLSPACQ